MDINTSTNSYKLSEEEIKKYREILAKAVPYTEKEIVDIPLDSWYFDIDRMSALNAQRALKKAGLL
ncbi:MAG: hypothetical protein UD936_12005 [Acutalibacteraceae bacterium]|nr:hypothetical protein [Acutalibacteraceae bacterium]